MLQPNGKQLLNPLAAGKPSTTVPAIAGVDVAKATRIPGRRPLETTVEPPREPRGKILADAVVFTGRLGDHPT